MTARTQKPQEQADPATPGMPARADVGRLVAPTRRSTGAALAEQINTAIALGEFAPGQRLPPERELADMLAVSRSTVRAAVARLAAMNLVEIRRGRTGGAYIRSSSPGTPAQTARAPLAPPRTALAHLTDLHQLIEALVARTAAERRGRDDVQAINNARRNYERANHHLREVQIADLAFHHAIACATHNDRLLVLRERLLTESSERFAVMPLAGDSYHRALPEHEALATAVSDGNPDAAWLIAKQHFAISRDETEETSAGTREVLPPFTTP